MAGMIAERLGEGRGSPFQGWAVVTVQPVRDLGHQVLESPRLDNPYHADIRFPAMTGDDVRDQVKQRAYALARLAKFRPAPSDGRQGPEGT